MKFNIGNIVEKMVGEDELCVHQLLDKATDFSLDSGGVLG